MTVGIKITLTVKGTNRETVSGGKGTEGQGTGGPSLLTPTTRTSAVDQVPDPPLAAVKVTQTVSQHIHKSLVMVNPVHLMVGPQ